MAEDPFWAKDDDGHVHKLQWDKKWFKVSTNEGGSTGFATVLSSASLNGSVRLHLCAKQPCTARWTCVSRYGIYGPPTHMQPHVSPPLAPPAASPEPSEPAAGTSSTAVAVEDPTPVPSSSGDAASILSLLPVRAPRQVSDSSSSSSSSSESSGDTAAGTSSTAAAVEDPTPVPSSSADTAAGTSSAAVAAENPPPAPSASDVKIPEPAPGAPNYARSQS